MSTPNTKLNQEFCDKGNTLNGEFYEAIRDTSIWHHGIRKTEWTDGLSDSRRVITVERNLPENTDYWSTSTNNEPHDSFRSYSVVQKPIESNKVCVDDSLDEDSVRREGQKAILNLRNALDYTWRRRAQLEYTRISDLKVVVVNGLPHDHMEFPSVFPTGKLTAKVLGSFQDHIPEGAVIVTDANTLDWVGTPEGFSFERVALTRRWKMDEGKWVEILPYEFVSDENGQRAVLSQEYRNAQVQDTVLFLPSVMEFEVPRPIREIGSDEWDPQRHIADIQWMNIQNDDENSPYYNPDGCIGFYRALIQAATKPLHPEHGVVIRHLR